MINWGVGKFDQTEGTLEIVDFNIAQYIRYVYVHRVSSTTEVHIECVLGYVEVYFTVLVQMWGKTLLFSFHYLLIHPFTQIHSHFIR